MSATTLATFAPTGATFEVIDATSAVIAATFEATTQTGARIAAISGAIAPRDTRVVRTAIVRSCAAIVATNIATGTTFAGIVVIVAETAGIFAPTLATVATM